MKNIIYSISFSLIFFFFAPTISYSTPNIDSISGTIAHKESVIISGGSFLLKSTAAPVRYDNFENGTVDTSVQGYSLSGSPEPRYSKEKIRYAGTQSAFQDFTGHYSQYMRMTTTHLGSSRKALYFSGWFNMETGGAPSRNTKILNMGAGTGWQTRVDVYPDTGSGHLYAHTNSCSGGASYVQDWSVDNNAALKDDGNWHRLEGWLNLGTSSGGGYRNIIMDGKQLGEVSGTFVDGDCSLTYLLFGHYFARDTGSPTPWAKRFWDEIYVDDTRSRVEFCSGSSWANRGRCEIQIPSAWSSTSITATVNQGVFAAAEAAYIYVVDSTGSVNSSGYPIIIGQSQEGPSAPSTPSSFNVTSPQ